MPPFNEARRDRLADAAIEILAADGARGLTHRAVDAEAGEPPGTTSRYFRTRDALTRAVVARIRELHFADLARAPAGPVEPEAIAGHLAGLVRAAVTGNRSRHLAFSELFLEATRRPHLRAALDETRAAQIELMRKIHRAAGVELTPYQGTLLVTCIGGLVTSALTTPEVIGIRSPADVAPVVDRMMADIAAGVRAVRESDPTAGTTAALEDGILRR
jgi:DNA-binding transcriptional regulator YbjK